MGHLRLNTNKAKWLSEYFRVVLSVYLRMCVCVCVFIRSSPLLVSAAAVQFSHQGPKLPPAASRRTQKKRRRCTPLCSLSVRLCIADVTQGHTFAALCLHTAGHDLCPLLWGLGLALGVFPSNGSHLHWFATLLSAVTLSSCKVRASGGLHWCAFLSVMLSVNAQKRFR